jgi:hypothetical protein
MVDNENEDIKSKNISPFIKRIFKKEENITFDKLLRNLPTIPKIYFKDYDDTGNNIINTFNFIKSTINKLRITKDFILSILKMSKSDLEKIEIDRTKYLLDNNNLIIKFKSNYTETFNDNSKFDEFKENYNIRKFASSSKKKFNEFIEKYSEERYNIFKNIKNNIPFFYYIFQNEYKNSENKTFFIDLFKKYSKIRNTILPYINTDYGIIGFNMVFDIKDNIYFSDIINSEKEKLKKDDSGKNTDINYTKYILNGENIIDSIENNSKIKTSATASTPSTKSSPTIKPSKPSLKDKIHKYNLLYLEKYDASYYINLQNNNLKNIYEKIISSKDNCFQNESSNLYNITINLIELEFSITEFIFNYIDNKIFDMFINTHIKIKRYIYEQINIFDINYDQYINWYNRIIKEVTDYYDTSDLSKDDYENFYDIFDKIIKSIDVKYKDII